ncbi:MAG: gamma-glutamyl-gamma-aminobutyrate hydrolase family protein [Gemmatimonadota bacterium]|jgi:putative glutamine amidotransferase
MDSRAVVGVPTQTLQAIDDIPGALPHSWVMSRRYVTALALTGVVPLLVPLLDDDEATLRAIYDRLDGVFLAGGVDMDPALYGETRHELCGRIDPARDTVELLLTRWALADGKPVFGVCRGLQLVNVALGGTLWQDCTLYPRSIKHDYFPSQGFHRDHPAHDVTLAPGSGLRRTFGVDTITVNSMHHQGIRRLGRGLRATATASDGLVEAVELDGDRFAVAVQWHPEALIDDDDRTKTLFREFADACVAWSSAARGAATRPERSRRRA